MCSKCKYSGELNESSRYDRLSNLKQILFLILMKVFIIGHKGWIGKMYRFI